MIELKNVYFERDNKKILDNINLKINDDQFVVITGPNGSGKSTLMKIIMGIERQDAGEIYFNGQEISNLSIDERAKLGIAYAFQQPVKFKGLTVYELIKLAARKDIKKDEACNILSKVGLCAKEYVDREINASLSGGELKRIEIAMAFARKAELTIFDEPEAGIDLWSFNHLINVFEAVTNETKGVTMIISHQERILDIASKIILMENGKIKKCGTKEEIMPMVLENKVCCKLGGNING